MSNYNGPFADRYKGRLQSSKRHLFFCLLCTKEDPETYYLVKVGALPRPLFTIPMRCRWFWYRTLRRGTVECITKLYGSAIVSRLIFDSHRALYMGTVERKEGNQLGHVALVKIDSRDLSYLVGDGYAEQLPSSDDPSLSRFEKARLAVLGLFPLSGDTPDRQVA